MSCARGCFVGFFLRFFYPIYSSFASIYRKNRERTNASLCKKWISKWKTFKKAQEDFEEVFPQIDIKVCNKYGEFIDLIHVEFAEVPLGSPEDVFCSAGRQPELAQYLKFFLYHYEAHVHDMVAFLKKHNIYQELPLLFYYRSYKDNNLYVLGLNLKEETYVFDGSKILFGEVDFGVDKKEIVA